jgi:uncharacterized protein (TIGR02246 family)
MIRKRIALIAAVLAGVVGVGLGAAWDRLRIQPAPLNAAEPADKPTAAADEPAAAPDKDKAPDDKPRDADRNAVRAAVNDFVKAFDKGDAKGMANMWTEEGEYVTDDGTTLRGRAAIEDGYSQSFKKSPGLKLDVNVESIRFVSHDSAVLEGVARSHKGDKTGEPTASRISVLFARENDKWLLALLKEWPDDAAALDDVDWLIGSWESKNDDADVITTYEWEEGRSFIRAHFTIKNKEKGTTLGGTQLIGKDPRTGQLHSWLFENDGAFSESVWTWENNKRWRLDTAGVESDGDETTAVNLLTPLDKNSFTWQSASRTSGGEDLPDIPPVKVVRVK